MGSACASSLSWRAARTSVAPQSSSSGTWGRRWRRSSGRSRTTLRREGSIARVPSSGSRTWCSGAAASRSSTTSRPSIASYARSKRSAARPSCSIRGEPMPSGGCGACGSSTSRTTPARASSCSARRRSRSSWCSPPPRRAAPRSPLWSSSTCSSPRLAGATRCASGASSPRSIRSAAPQASTETSPAPCASRSRG